MPDIHVGANFQPGGISPNPGASEAAHATGSYEGRAVAAQPNAMSLLADAAEELTFSFSELREKSLSERKLKSSDRSNAAEKIQEWVEKVQGIGEEDLTEFLRKFREAGGDPQALKQLLQQYGGGDAAEEHALLSFARDMCEDAPDLVQILDDALATLDAERGEEVRAGLNIAPVGADAAGGGRAGRALYREVVLGQADIADTFLLLLDRSEARNVTEASEYLIKAIGADLSSMTPSTTTERLHTANQDLSHVQMLANLHRDCDTLLGDMAARHGVEPSADAAEVMKKLLALKDERFIDGHRIRDMLPLAGRNNPEHDVHLLTGFKNLVHKMPMKVFQDPTTRQTLLNAIQGELDVAIDLEEEMLDA